MDVIMYRKLTIALQSLPKTPEEAAERFRASGGSAALRAELEAEGYKVPRKYTRRPKPPAPPAYDHHAELQAVLARDRREQATPPR